MELFNEVKNKYFRILIKLLNQAKVGMERNEIIKIIDEEEYSQKLIDKNSRTFTGMILNDYNEKYNFGLLEEKDEKYYPKINKSNNIIPIRLTIVEKMWLKSILNTEFIKLFLDDKLIKYLKMELKEVNSCIKDEYIEFTNIIKLDYKYDKSYKNNFRKILDAILNEKIISYYEFDSKNEKYLEKIAFPVTIEYSIRDSDFRVSMYLVDEKISLNKSIFKLDNVKIFDNTYKITREKALEMIYNYKYSKEPIILEIFDKRQAMERCFMCFSGLERTAKIIGEKKYEITLLYYLFNEEEIIKNILSLGPYVKVILPTRIKEEVIIRLKKTMDLLEEY